eukprot:TRINITY_DN5259_c0_g1_i7.p2 TRINITY_DN5259_c0_g1~~TRINITY_DN5259_c0_g1_i7.p2  ORF type:complete len:250 (+),score=-43.42 TRINITY_DN5259_c0_g1_i7:195-944(+)
MRTFFFHYRLFTLRLYILNIQFSIYLSFHFYRLNYPTYEYKHIYIYTHIFKDLCNPPVKLYIMLFQPPQGRQTQIIYTQTYNTLIIYQSLLLPRIYYRTLYNISIYYIYTHIFKDLVLIITHTSINYFIYFILQVLVQLHTMPLRTPQGRPRSSKFSLSLYHYIGQIVKHSQKQFTYTIYMYTYMYILYGHIFKDLQKVLVQLHTMPQRPPQQGHHFFSYFHPLYTIPSYVQVPAPKFLKSCAWFLPDT